ncbi:MAG: endonuclease V [Polyangiaceae bacterium]
MNQQTGSEIAKRLSPFAIVDVHYEGDEATAACVVAADWGDETGVEERVVRVSGVQEYRPGAFYERELPCLVAVLALVKRQVRAIVVDGYVELDAQGAPGLGAHVHSHFGGATPVIGVAKTSFRGSGFAVSVVRGASKSPLFVTARGVGAEEAARLVRGMHGSHRLPTLIKRVDSLARGLSAPSERG